MARLQRQAVLAGLSTADAQATLADQHLREEIVAEQDDGRTRYGVEGTPTFVFGRGGSSDRVATYADFAARVDTALAPG